MKKFILIITLLLLSVWLGLRLSDDPGYALFAYHTLRVEMPLWVVATLFILSVFAITALILMLSNVLRLRAVISHWNRERHQRRADRITNRGLIQLTEGKWHLAEADLIKGAGRSQLPLINYLMAARAAGAQGASERRDEYLRAAHLANPKAQVAIGLSQAELQLAHHQDEQALATLQKLREIAPKHPYVLKLLLSLYTQLQDWQAVQSLLPDCVKYKVIDKPTAEHTLLKARVSAFKERLSQADDNTIHQFWLQTSKTVRNHPKMVELYARYLLREQQFDEAQSLLSQAISKSPTESLIALYGEIPSTDSSNQLKRAERWLHPGDRNPVLLRTLGQLSIANQLWGKARDYLEESAQLAPSQKTYALLAQVYESDGELQKALHLYKSGLELSTT